MTISKNEVNGQVNVTVQSVYFDPISPVDSPSRTQSSGRVTVGAQLTADGAAIGSRALGDYTFDVKMPIGRCYRLDTFSTYGVRGHHTRDPFGNRPEQIDYGRVPSATSLAGPETKWVGFHDGSRIYDINNGRPLFAGLSNKDSLSRTRYYSSEAHRTAHHAQSPKEVYYPSKIIPVNYFLVMSFNETGVPYIGEIRLLGSDNNTYKLGAPWAIGYQDDTSRENDAFHWYIFAWSPPAGVTFSYAFISNVAGVEPPDITEPPGSLTFTATQPGNVLVGQNINLQIGTVSGGVIEEDLKIDPGNVIGGDSGGDSFKQEDFRPTAEV